MASIHARVCAELLDTSFAMPDSVSPGLTVRELPSAVEPVTGDEEGLLAAGVWSAGRRDSAGAGAGWRAMAPSRVPPPVEGAATGAFCCAPGANTGGSSNRVYSRTV